MRLRGRHYRTGEVIDVVAANGRVTTIEMGSNQFPDHEAEWIAPGFFDLQVNGAGGVSFNSGDLTIQQVQQALRKICAHGVTGLLPTLVTNDPTALEHAVRTLRLACESDEFTRRRVPGLHLEGPWISPIDGFRGAHPRQHVGNPDWSAFQRLQDAAGGRIRMVTLSPELPGAIDFIEQLVSVGVRVGLGHTAANAETITAAQHAGATLSTHLGNGLPELIHRHHNPMWAQLSCPELFASVIMDGHHVPESLFRTVVISKLVQRTLLISDASSLAGLLPGRYRQWDHDVELTADGRLVLFGTPYLAGSACFLDHCVAYAANILNDLPSAIDMASIVPRQLLGIPIPEFTVAAPVDFVLFDRLSNGQIQVRHTT